MDRTVGLVALVVLVGCAGIRIVSETPAGGELVLNGPREAAMGKARDEMAHACGAPNAYEIVEEGELGFSAEAGPGQDPKEWHVHFECTKK